MVRAAGHEDKGGAILQRWLRRHLIFFSANVVTTLRGHLKCSHIADKRKNFHMALYPLPPSSNESVIDNGSIVWQMAMHIILILPNNLSKQCRRSHAGTLPWRFSVHALIAKMNKGKISNSRKRYDFYFNLFLFLHVQKRVAMAGVDLQCRTGASACYCLFSAFKPGLQKPIDICDGLIAAVCAPPAFFVDLFEIAH